jgi:hypothetical protein
MSPADRKGDGTNNIVYVIGAVVIIVVVLRVLGLW